MSQGNTEAQISRFVESLDEIGAAFVDDGWVTYGPDSDDPDGWIFAENPDPRIMHYLFNAQGHRMLRTVKADAMEALTLAFIRSLGDWETFAGGGKWQAYYDTTAVA